MWSKLKEVFDSMGYPYSRQGSYQEGDSIPESLFTFWNADTPDDGFFDNKANRTVWVWYVYFYTKDPNLLYSVLDEFYLKAKAKGFIPNGKAKDIPSDVPNYLGRYMVVRYIEEIKGDVQHGNL